jgi:copper chaperone NosL
VDIVKRTAVALVALLAAGCSSLPPSPIASGDVCTRCHRTIRDTRLAAEIIDSVGRAWKFRTAGCMATYVAEKNPDAAVIYVTDYKTGRLVKASAATFVLTTVGKAPDQEQVYLAYSSSNLAREAAGLEKTTPMEWDELVEASRTSSN